MKIVPADYTIADVETKAAEHEAQPSEEQGSIAVRLKERAAQCRQWIAELKNRKWTS